ncbi:MAG: succinylglutamate desuccinylase/aspartoacylase family protein [Phycisphaeraceae bacterium]|nr:succinylglutamate desuccinylase/aspartoacylase family protein [Phycisphaeraceae bacterium]
MAPASPSPESDPPADDSSVTIDGTVVGPGERRQMELPVANLPTQTPLHLPVEVICGRRPGPRLWLSAAIHGDELNGMEIIHRVLQRLDARNLRGQVIAVPIVNVFGFIQQDRYLPDRRDLNRCFPGSPRGSLASRLAHLLMTEIVGQCTHGIDLHTASHHRINLPQVRGNLDDPATLQMAEAFGAPIMIHGDAPGGSLRAAVARQQIPVITYEAGEPHRFNREAVDLGVKGVLRVMSDLKMRGRKRPRARQSMQTRRRTWVRAPRSGILRLAVKLGTSVTRKQPLGHIHDAFGGGAAPVTSPADGMVIGHTLTPLVNQGDGIIHIAKDIQTTTPG